MAQGGHCGVIILPTRIGADAVFSPVAAFLGRTKDQILAEEIARHTLEQAALKLEAWPVLKPASAPGTRQPRCCAG
jgi:hypothetical protein